MVSYRLSLVVVPLLLTALVGTIESGQEKPPASDRNSLIMMTVTVWKRDGQYVQGLSRDAFAIMDEKVSRPIEFFENADTPVSVGILIDTSLRHFRVREFIQSQNIQQILTRIVQLGHPRNDYFLLSFDKPQNP